MVKKYKFKIIKKTFGSSLSWAACKNLHFYRYVIANLTEQHHLWPNFLKVAILLQNIWIYLQCFKTE